MVKRSMTIAETIKGYIIDCRTLDRSERTIERYEQKLNYFVRWLSEEEEIDKLNQVTIDHLRSFVLHVKAAPLGRVNLNKDDDSTELSPLTVKGHVQVTKGFFNWCFKEELIKVNPAARLGLPSVPSYIIATFTPDHIRALLDACDRSTVLGYRDYTIILVLLETGIRVSELCGLRLQDVHEDHIRVFGKGKKQREIGVSPGVSKVLWKYIHQYRGAAPDAETLAFVNRHGHPLTKSGIERFLVALKNKAGVAGVRVSAHTFRHTFACTYMENGGEIYKLSRLMGHSSVEVTEEYLKVFNLRVARQNQDHFSAVSTLDLLNKRKRKNVQ